MLLACRHHIHELVSKSAFEIKIHSVPKSPNIPLFKNLEITGKYWIPIAFTHIVIIKNNILMTKKFIICYSNVRDNNLELV